MNQKELKELIDYLVEKDIAEFEFERGDVKVRVKRGKAIVEPQYAPAEPRFVTPPATQAPASAGVPTAPPAPAAPAAAAETEEEAGLHVIRSPIVGTFYEAPSPGAPAFVKVGDTVREGQVMCIIEAMKLMNEIECDAAGEIVKRYVVNAQPVEYGQPLFAIRKRT
jgi:acetyl-CoA carboxylase biotin carboxyl carrier protein